MQSGGLAVGEAGRTLAGSSDLRGLQAVMYREGTHTSSAEAFNAVNTRQGLLSRMNGSMWRRPWIYLMQAPHPTDMYSNIYIQRSSFITPDSDWCQFWAIYTHHTGSVVLKALGSPPPMLTGISSFSLLLKHFCPNIQIIHRIIYQNRPLLVHKPTLYRFMSSLVQYSMTGSFLFKFKAWKLLKKKQAWDTVSRKIPRTCFY